MSDDEVAALQEELSDARVEVGRLQMAAADAEARASTLNEQNGDLRSSLEQAEAGLDAARRESQGLQIRLQEATARYREALLASSPDLPEEIVAGETIEELDAAAEQARQTVRRVRDRLESEAQSGRVPAGAPPRSGPDVSSLSPIEKIRLGLNQT